MPDPLQRARAYRALAALFARPTSESLATLRESLWPGLLEALGELGAAEELRAAAGEVAEALATTDASTLLIGYNAAFEPSGGLSCPPTETSHTNLTPAHGLTRNVEAADVAGFYKAFGVKVSHATERPDHITAELEFVQFLAVKEALATENGGAESEEAAVCRDAAGLFLRDHLALWVGAFAECLAMPNVAAPYRLAAPLLSGFVARDTAAMGHKASAPNS